MVTDSLCEIFAAPQIILVLIIALIVFGPKRLPELGKQLGSALRELHKAKNEFTRNFNTDYEPDPEPYTPADHTDYSYQYPAYEPPPMDLTDYTIVGQTPAEPVVQANANAVSRQEYAAAAESYDYVVGASGLPGKPAGPYTPAETLPSASATPASGAASEPAKEGEPHV
jgi:TatA/E family protein of Tat protein translocase